MQRKNNRKRDYGRATWRTSELPVYFLIREYIMKKIPIFLIAVFIAIGGVYANLSAAQKSNPPKSAKSSFKAESSCKSCHTDFSSVIPKNHPPVQGNGLDACTACHKPGQPMTENKNAFSTGIHKGHLSPKGNLDCLACHTWSPGKSFGLIGMKESWGKPTQEDLTLMKEIFNSWASSDFTDNLHSKANISCINCHGRGLPEPDSTVENAECMKCHGPMEQLAKKTEPSDFKDRNPHQSHLGEIACTVCHKAHSPSKVYCLDCHQKFNMTIKGAGKSKQ